ncbi:endolytic transglycosylase MltG [Canibacter sp. lx-45]|uniref:endolytic transglycosylase MltG n=1 Tax=Canibacter zhuwentaonis TaxID=2837491 RepID=UPI001BDBF838|nr:endolytic transglycosylase MltG [Canibacter zhuwentaonis]MBT1035039.1 endolytic transglycosylase MltG [Canibacter zhuwentaonis]
MVEEYPEDNNMASQQSYRPRRARQEPAAEQFSESLADQTALKRAPRRAASDAPGAADTQPEQPLNNAQQPTASAYNPLLFPEPAKLPARNAQLAQSLRESQDDLPPTEYSQLNMRQNSTAERLPQSSFSELGLPVIAQNSTAENNLQQGSSTIKNKKRFRIVVSTIIALLLIGALAFTGKAIIDGVRDRFGIGVSLDYEGAGEGEVFVTVKSGDTGSDIAEALAEANVVKTAEGFVKYLLRNHPEAVFDVGSYKLKHKMSPEAAYTALQDPKNKEDLVVTLPEGISADQAFERFSAVTGIPLEDFKQAAANYQALGVPTDFPSIEGFIFPATYELNPDDTASDILRKTVDRMWQALQEHGVTASDAHKILTMAALVQREAGADKNDFPKIARVFYNRLEKDMHLESDATVAYGTGRTHTVWTTAAERADASNKYNTYANPGLPIGPIGLPGDIAIKAALKPANGNWLYFVPINLETGETAFAETFTEHEKNTDLLADWCNAHRAAGGTRCD